MHGVPACLSALARRSSTSLHFTWSHCYSLRYYCAACTRGQVFIVPPPFNASGGGVSVLPDDGSTHKRCAKPHIGKLCGAEALGVIIGIVVGGLLIIALFVLFLYCIINRVSARVR